MNLDKRIYDLVTTLKAKRWFVNKIDQYQKILNEIELLMAEYQIIHNMPHEMHMDVIVFYERLWKLKRGNINA